MSNVLTFPHRAIARQLGPIDAVIAGSQLINLQGEVIINNDPILIGGSESPLLELRVIFRLADVPSQQRQTLSDLIQNGDLLTLTLKTAGGGEGG